MTGWSAAPRSPFARAGVREQQRAAMRERIFEAAVAEFRAAGFERASVAEIARVAGVSRPTVYQHFPTLDHVLFELCWRLGLQVVQQLGGVTGLRASLDRLADALIDGEASVGDPALFREMISVFARRAPAPDLDPGQNPVLVELVRRFETARDAGELRRGLPPEQAARLCLSGVFGHLLGIHATPADRRADLRALFSLYEAERA